MKTIYRKANLDDAVELKQLNDEFNGEGSNSVENIKEGLMREESETVIVAKVNNKLVGFCCGQLLKSICYSVFYAEISELYVNDSVRKQGIGKGLINFIEDYYRQKDIHNFQLFTGKENEGAQKFYEKIGYRCNDEIFYRKRDIWLESQSK